MGANAVGQMEYLKCLLLATMLSDKKIDLPLKLSPVVGDSVAIFKRIYEQ